MTQQKNSLIFIHNSLGVVTGQSTINLAVKTILTDAFDFIDINLGGYKYSRWAKSFRLFISLLRVLYATLILQIKTAYVSHSRSSLGIICESPLILLLILSGAKVYLHWHGAEILHWSTKRWRIHKILLLIAKHDQVTNIVLTPKMKQKLNMLGIRSAKVISNFADIKKRSIKNEKNGGWELLFCSNLLPEKGVFDAIEVYRMILSEMPDVKLNIIGAGDSAIERKVLSELENLPGAVFWGKLLGAEKEAIFDKSDILLFPSSYLTEAQPLVVIEAMCHGLPTLAYRHNLMSDIVDNEVGALVDLGAIDEMAEAVLKICRKPENLARTSRECLARSHNYSKKEFTRKVLEVVR